MSEIDIAVQGVCMDYLKDGKPVRALANVDLNVRRGELVCILGPSGCGKSTLLRVMLGLLSPTAGNVLIDEDRRREGVAYIQQGSSLLPWRTLFQNACLGAEVRGKLTPDVVSRIRSELERYGLAGFEDHLYGELSGGMRQRTDIVRALESRPTLLFCDEPFSAIDFVTRLELSTRFKQMCKIGRITTVFVTHNIEEAIFLGDEVFVMSKRPGAIVRSYRPEIATRRDDAVEYRQSPEFGRLFKQIWSDLGHNEGY